MAFNGLSRRNFLTTAAGAALVATTPGTEVVAQGGLKILKSRCAQAIETLDPGWRLGTVDDDIMRAVWQGLISVKPGEEWGWEKQLASDIVQESPTRIRFELRKGVPWSGGFGEVTAEDVKFSYERIANPDNKMAYRTDWEKLARVDVTGTHSGVIHLKEPFMPLWLSTLPAGSGLVISKKAMEAKGIQKITTDVLAVCGPYRIKTMEPRRIIVLERNPLWQGEKPAYDEIHYIVILDANAAEIAFEAGEIDFTHLPIASVARLQKKLPPKSKLIVKPSLAYWWLGMQSEDGPFKDIRVRQAVQHAIDVDMVLEGAFFGVATRATGIIAPGLLGHRPKNLVEKPDLARAKKLLADAGFPNGFKTDIGVRNSAEFVNAAQVAAASLAKVGIQAEVRPFDSGAQKALAGDKAGGWNKMGLHIVRFSMQPDPSWATAWFVSEQVGEWNWERFKNPEFDKLHGSLTSELDEKKRDQGYQRMQDLMEQSGSYVFLTHGVNAAIHRDTVVPALSPDAQRQFWNKFKPA
ncbi:MAG: peptide ABC transporter substrate-binding protein [Alphaproteobacteria bacterium]|nr:peptide ABC transporter substrate-binding protein [Alphaproteobacteria bacterium]